jgi:TonB family protein
VPVRKVPFGMVLKGVRRSRIGHRKTPESVLTVHFNARGEEADMPAQPVQVQTAQPQRLLALTRDPALSHALQELASGDVTVGIVADMRGFSGELLHHTGAVALIDASALDTPLENTVDAIASQFPDLRLLIAGHSTEQTLLTTRIASQRVFRFVHKPVSPQRLKLFLEAAARPPERTARTPTLRPQTAETEPLARIETVVRGKSPQTLALIGLAVLAAIAAGAWALWPTGDAAPARAVQPAPRTAVVASPQVQALISQGDQAFADGRFVATDGSSAAERYRDALKLDSANAVARSGFDRSLEFGFRSAEDAILGGRLNDAAKVTEALRLIAPNNSRLAFLDTQISREQARVSADASQRQTQEARLLLIRESLVRMNERVRRGALLDPATNSALSHFREAEVQGPGEAAVRSARESLVGALLTAADNELTARRPNPARRLIDAAASINSSAPGLDVMRRRLEEVAAPATANVEGSAPTGNADSAGAAAADAPAATSSPAAPAAATPSVVASSSLRATRTAVPEYPARALQQLLSGWVELEFTVTPTGTVRDIVVTNAEPRRTFDAAAVAAMRRYRYAPVIKDGTAVSQRARIRMRFSAADDR